MGMSESEAPIPEAPHPHPSPRTHTSRARNTQEKPREYIRPLCDTHESQRSTPRHPPIIPPLPATPAPHLLPPRRWQSGCGCRQGRRR